MTNRGSFRGCKASLKKSVYVVRHVIRLKNLHTEEIIRVMNELKAAEYKTNVQNLTEFLYICKKQSENEIKNIPLTMASKRIALRNKCKKSTRLVQQKLGNTTERSERPRKTDTSCLSTGTPHIAETAILRVMPPTDPQNQ